MHTIAKQLIQIEDELNDFFLERRDMIRAMLLAVLAGEHIFAIGTPGVAKSMIYNTFIAAIQGATHFSTQLTKRKPAEDVIGPLDILEFRNNGNYFYKRKGYATMVDLATLDEIGKASPVLLNELLTLLNERGYHEVNGGRSFHPSPLSTAFTASNEMLTDESESSAAIWDRLLVRVIVEPIKSSRNFAKLLTSTSPTVVNTIEWDDLKAAITTEVPAVVLSKDTVAAMVKLRKTFAAEHLYPSDRRWRWSVKLMQANAFLNGRSATGPEDLAVLRWTLWETIEQFQKISDLCLAASNPFVKPLQEIRKSINELTEGVKSRESGDDGAKWQYGKEAMDKLKIARDRMDTMLMEAMGEPIPGFKEVSDAHVEAMTYTVMVCLGQSEAGAKVMIADKLGSGDGGNK